MDIEHNLDELLDITTSYLDSQDVSRYLPADGNSLDAEVLAEQMVKDIEQGILDELPPELRGNLFYAYDLWDLVCYFRRRYDLNIREEVFYKYYLSEK